MIKTMNVALALVLSAASSAAAAQEAVEPVDPAPDLEQPAAVLEESDAKPLWEEYERLISQKQAVGTLGPGLLGDQVSFYSGTLTFQADDVGLPGNFGLPVGVTRTYSVKNRKGYSLRDLPFGDWDMDLPNISGVFTAQYGWITSTQYPDSRCSVPNTPPPVLSTYNDFHAHEYWNGYHMNLPGAGGGELLTLRPEPPKPSTGGPYYWRTSDWTHLSCLSGDESVKNASGEGFLAVTADGTKYWFDWMASFEEPRLKKDRRDAVGIDYLARRRLALYATRAEDRFGNRVTYTYDNSASSPVRLISMQASDGRSIAFTYNADGRVDTVTAAGKVWRYQYSGGSLSQVLLPDGHQWTIDFSGYAGARVRYWRGQPGDPLRNCMDPGDVVEDTFTGVITHPSGARGEFTIMPTRFGRSNVLAMCSNVTTPDGSGTDPNDPNDDVAYYPIAWDALALVKKTISGPGLAPSEWNYGYGSTISWFYGPGGDAGTPVCTSGDCIQPQCVSDSCAGTATTVVVGPGNDFTRYTFGNSYRYNEAKLLKVEKGTGPTAIASTETSVYELAQSGLPFAAEMGRSPQRRSGAGFVSEFPRPLKRATIAQDGATFSSAVDSFDAFARPLSVTRSSSLGFSRTDVTSYHDNLSKWVLGQVTQVVNTNTTPNVVLGKTEYDATTALPVRMYGPGTPVTSGKLQQTLTYNTTATVESGQRGTLATVKDGRNNVTTLSTWKRGIPQLIQHPPTPESPSGATESAAVNDDGTIASVSDENGYKTCYGYDAMGRLSGITYPSETAPQPDVCDTSAWNRTALTFESIATAEYGLPAGHWKHTVSTGNGRKISYLDTLWRPVVKESYDSANPATTRSITVNRYDPSGRVAFESYSISSLGTYTDATLLGAHTTYDALSRITEVKQNWEHDSTLGLLTTSTEYLTGFQTRVTNPRGYATVTSYMAYDQPTADWPVAISYPSIGAYVDMARDPFGKPLSLTRRNASGSFSATRTYVYSDAEQKLCILTEPETGSTAFKYDAANNLEWSAAGLSIPSGTSCPDAKASAVSSGRLVTHSYDARNRLSTLTFNDGRGNQAWTYTPDGLPATVTTDNSPGGTQVTNTYTYNRRRLLREEATSQPGGYSWTLGYRYNSNGQQNQVIQPGGETINYSPNALGQATQVQGTYGTYASGVSYFPNGAIKQFTYGNGIVHNLTQNARGLPDVSRDAYGSQEYLDDGYDYDANGNVAAISDGLVGGQSNRTMTYDSLDRLKTTVSPMFSASPSNTVSYTYDLLDNLTRVVAPGRDHYYCYNPKWQLTNVKASSCSGTSVIGLGYDEQGNLDNKNGQDYDFDLGNRLRAVADKEVYRYDGYGRRVMASSLQGLGDVVSQYGQDGVLRYQQDFRQGKAFNYVYLGGSLIAIREAPLGTTNNTFKYQHTDALGSPVAVTDANRTVLGERNEYEPFGKVLKPATPKDGPGYTGHVLDAATGLNYMQQRYYDPGIGRFLSVDPVTANSGTGGNFNRYWYANNNPYRFTDPDGRQSRELNFETQQSGYKRPPRSDKDWLGPAIGVALTAVLAAPVAAEAGLAALANPGAVATGTEILAGAAGVTGTAGAALSSRVSQVHSALDPIAASMRTTAGLQTAQGARIFGSGAVRDLTPAQRSLLGAGEIAAKAPGAHAEATVLGAAAQRGLTPASMEVSRTICPACQQLIESTGGRVVTPQRAEW